MRSIPARQWLFALRLTAFAAALGIALLVAVGPHPARAADVPIDGLTAVNSSPTLRGNTTSLTATVSAGTNVTYTWDFGDTAAGSAITTTHTYTASGVYTATVTAVNDAGPVTATTLVYVGDALVDVGPNGQSSFSPKAVTIPPGGTVVWTLRSGMHSVTADDDSFEQPLGSGWLHYAHTFPADAVPVGTTILYHCIAHGAAGGIGMSGSVVVSPTSPARQTLKLPFLSRR